MTHEEALTPLDHAIWELGEAFTDFPAEDLWVRAHPRLWSAGELAAHIAFGESRWLMPDLVSPLAREEVSYYAHLAEEPLRLEMNPEEVYAEVKRVHESCKAHILALRPDLDAPLPKRDDWTWGYALEYMAFHIAYHAGQIYSVRHLLGHETPDN